ncbi:hypothetical protein [Streptomyces sp. NPDC054834]
MTRSPVLVVVAAMDWTMTSWLVSGRPRQFMVMCEKSRCSTERHRVDIEHDPVYGRARSWVRPRAKAWPMAEELFATAPARVINKQDEALEEEWDALLSGAAAQLPLA